MAFNGVGTLEFFIHNVFLPPKLPQSGDDSDSASHEAELLNIVIKALDKFSSHVHHTHHDAVKSAQRAMGIFRELKGSSEFIIEEKLVSALSQLAYEDANFPLHVSAQNAGIIVTRQQNQVLFESFELSPENKDVMGTKGRLRRCFPASSVSIPIETYCNEGLRQALAYTIAKMGHQEVSEAKPKIREMGEVQIEERDTTDPYLVTDFLHTVLQTVGEARDPSVIWKNTREEVVLKDAKLPWRRSPIWLLIRVALQIHLNRLEKQQLYKEFMIFLMSYLLEMAQEKKLPSEFLYCMIAKIEKRLIKLRKETQYPWLPGKRWKEISQHADPKLSLDDLSRPISEGEILDSYSDLDKFIDRIHQRQKCVTKSEGMGIPSFEGGSSEELEFELLAFEEWSHLMTEETCKSLAEAMKSYHQHARSYYKRSPESTSIMLLTILELLLLEYSPEIPYELLQSLILYSSNHLERLYIVESYLKRRHDKSPSRCSAFSSFGEPGSFSELRRRIETEATQEREQKYEDLKSLANIPHTYYKSTDSLGCTHSSHFSYNCTKCDFDRDADNLSIEIHEWPLPSNELKSQSTIFELEVPNCFNAWRNATMFVIHDVLKCEYSQRREGKLAKLSEYMSSGYNQVNRRLTVVSTTKPNRGTHRKGKNISTATEDDILLRNGMNYCFYDEQKNCLVSSFERTDNIPRDCMYELSEQNENLQDFIFRPAGKENGLSPNHVLSEQFSCSERLSLEEFKAMATLPIGFRLQWPNILVQLFNPTIDFNKPDAVLILMQVIHQAGPPLDSALYRASHNQLRDKEFAQDLFQGLSLQLDRIERNWESYVALKAFTSSCLVRRFAIKWICRLEAKAKTRNDEQREEFFSIISHISLICISSFDIEQVHLGNLLLQKDQSLSHSVGKPLDPISIGLNLQAKRVLYKAHRILIREVLECKNEGLDMAIKQRLASFNRGSEWKSLTDMDYHWLEAKDLESSKTYHVNLLNGEFLVNGFPPSRLPSEYETHPNFGSLFGRAMIEVTSSRDPGMSFSAIKPYQGYELLFGIDATGPVDLLLVASEKQESSPNPHKLELIPQRVFEEKLPTSFVHDYVHWYDRNSQTIEFRPKEQPWVASSSTNWVLRKVDSFWTLQKQGESLESLISSRSTLEDRHHMHLIILRHQFYLCPESSKIQCRQYRGMYVDENQGIGALVGLRSKLTLRDDRNNRKILIPNGKVDYRKSSQHVNVSIEHESSTRIHPYDVDTRLGRLVDNGSLASKLTLAYLHGLTSFCLPNQLTSKTGTEECLSILQSAAVRSFQALSGEDLSILTSISRLSPGREYYPKELKVMETTHWDSNLSFLSQDVSLNIEVQNIIKSAVSTRFFYQDSPIEIVRPKHVNKHLQSRHRIRASTFHVSGYGAESHTTSYDVEYQGRDRRKRVERSRNAYVIALTVKTMRKTLNVDIPQVSSDELWELLVSSSGTKGPYYPLEEEEEEVSYDSRWLSKTESFLPDIWCRFHRACGERKMQFRRFSLMFCLATMAYANDCYIGAIQALAAFANIASIGEIEPPRVNIFNMSKGYGFREQKLKDVVGNSLKSFHSSPESSMTRCWWETEHEFENRRSETFTNNQRGAISKLLEFFRGQFFREQGPCPVLKAPDWAYSSEYLYTGQIMEEVLPIWRDWYHNFRLFQYLKKVVHQLQLVPTQQLFIPTFLSSSPVVPPLDIQRGFINDADLFDHPPPLKNELVSSDLGLLDQAVHKQENGGALGTLVEFLRKRIFREFEHRYLEKLDASQKCREHSQGFPKLKKMGNELQEELRSHLSQCEEICKTVYSLLKGAVGSGEDRSPGVSSGSTYMGPRISSSFFLGQLARAHWERLPLDWKKAIRAERMFFQEQDEAALVKELLNPGHTNWDPMKYPESLLLEVESGIMIRDVQEEIAAHMRTPPNNKNAVMQLNMGEGKSSVIKLVRVIVAKPQAKELLRTLISKLGGLMDHQIYHMPFSRQLRLNASNAETNGGILLVQPEHLLSFQLMGIESQLNARGDYFNTCSRDLVDESDENFNVKFELIYTMGTQTPVEFSPERWVFIQSVQEAFPESIEMTSCIKGQFPRIRLLRKDAEGRLLALIADKIFQTGLRGFPIHRQPEEIRKSICKYVLDKDLIIADIECVEVQSGFFAEGLLAGGVLGFALREKRWRVNYGLDLVRNPKTRLAVPYRAKDNPTARSEFSHPDVVIVLTCLSYYYGGLSDGDLFTAFGHLLMTDQAQAQYDCWVQDAPDLDEAFHTLAGVAMKDQQQLIGDIFPHLSKSKSTIDYFLSHIVFAREMKEFPQKLSASGWDIGRTKELQRYTNALVAEYLLQQENDVVMKNSDADALLDLVIFKSPVQVILDVGAQILEMTNLQLAEAWLERIPQDHNKEAVIFFDDNDDICVLNRQGCIEKLQISPYYQQLDLCLVFLDEAHTRGTDLKLPKDYRAAVTLGAGLTKDRLVQACMRMRKLGQGQSVVFCVSEEIKAKITFLKNITNDESKTSSQKSTADDHRIKVLDVLAWTIWETFADQRRSIPMWALQGQRFENQKAIWESVTKHGEILMSPEEAELFLEDEAQSLENRYKPKGQDSKEQSIHASLPSPDGNPQLKAIHQRCMEFGVTEFGSSLLSEEQERELSPEIVQERQIERPQKVDPAEHEIHSDVTKLVKHGLFRPNESSAFLSAFDALGNTTASQGFDLSSFPDDIFVTEDFKRTVHLRSVQWILRKTSPDARHLIIISPHEAQELLPYIETSKHVHLHVYAPLPSLYYRPLDNLQLHVVPRMRVPWQPSQRQLNFSSYDDYVETCKMMYLSTTPTAKGFVVDPDGFIVSAPNGETPRFRMSPVKFLRIFLMAMRHQGDGNEKTHWGRILGGEILEKGRDFSAIT
ncbi:hypothetical protein F5X99DRAFT_429300 [Biscogniauxia marginata]|nr:hypothetical protein F5X99DRAFT_429300 [Biscogniauxia marginata]